MKKLNLILGIICVVLALVLFMAGSAVGGVVLLLIGGLNIIIGLKKKEALNPKIEAQNMEHPSKTMLAAFTVAGWEYYQQNILEVLGEPEHITNNDIKDMFIEGSLSADEPYYIYPPYITTPTLEHEPENPYDPKAIKVIIDGEHIGYVPKDKIDLVNGYLDNKTFEAEIYAGDYKMVSYKDDNDDYYGDDPKRSDLEVESFTEPYKVSIRIYEK